MTHQKRWDIQFEDTETRFEIWATRKQLKGDKDDRHGVSVDRPDLDSSDKRICQAMAKLGKELEAVNKADDEEEEKRNK